MGVERVLVVGGGIGGLSTTIALRRRGVEVDLVELNPKWDVYGVGIIQPGNAIRALDQLGLGEQASEDPVLAVLAPHDGDATAGPQLMPSTLCSTSRAGCGATAPTSPPSNMNNPGRTFDGG